VLLIVVGTLVSQAFLTVSNFAGIGQQISALGVVVVGESLILLIGGMGLSLESTFGLAPMVAAWLLVPVSAGLGGIDILVNNAGIGAAGTVADNPDDEWHRVYDVNVVGIVRVTRAALPYLRASAHAAVVNTCSIAATAGLPQRALYSATKGAVLSLTLAMAADHIHEGIRVNCVNPGTADTPWVGRLLEAADDPAAERAALAARQPMGRLVTAEEVAASIAYLASPLAASVTGTALAVDGGMAGLRLRPRS
jgi:2-keto-3-deoxy-L-fuconate dehydrogenase